MHRSKAGRPVITKDINGIDQKLAGLEIDEVTTTKRTTPLNFRKRLEKCEHPHHIEDLNLGSRYIGSGTQPTKLRSVRTHAHVVIN